VRRAPLLVLAVSTLLLAACGGGGDSERAAGIVHRAVVAARADNPGTAERFVGELPAGLPAEPPLHPDAEVIVSSRILGPAIPVEEGVEEEARQQIVLYLIVLDTAAGRDDVFAFYEEALDRGQWRLDSLVSLQETDRLDFSKRDDGDVLGTVQIVPDEADGRVSVFISLRDAGARVEDVPFEPGTSAAVPAGFPSEIPLPRRATVTGASFFRRAEAEDFLVIFVMRDGPDSVIAFYREAFDELGWTVRDASPIASEQRLRFDDEERGIIGELSVDALPENSRYSEATLEVSVAQELEEPEAPPTPAPTAEPAAG